MSVDYKGRFTWDVCTVDFKQWKILSSGMAEDFMPIAPKQVNWVVMV